MAKKTAVEVREEMNALQFKTLSESIDGLRHELKAEISAKDDLITLQLKTILQQTTTQLERILQQTTMTNGRVTKLELETKIWRFLQGYPKIAILIFFGVVFVMQYGLFELIKLIK